MKRTEVSKCVHIGVFIATYADADGTNAFPNGRTLAVIAGCGEETVTRCVRVLVAVGLLVRKRRPNQSSTYVLVLPLGKPVPWEEHLHLYTDTRQARRKKDLKAKGVAGSFAEPGAGGGRNPLRNGVRESVAEPVAERVSEPVPAGGSEEPGTRCGTGADTVAERVPEPVPAGGDHNPPTCGRDPGLDHDGAEVVPRPQVVGGPAAGNDQSSRGGQSGGLRRCEDCGQPLVRPGVTRCAACREPLPGQRRRVKRQGPTQSPLMAVVRQPVEAPAARVPFAWAPEDPLAPQRVCGCGRSYRSRTDGACQDCRFAAHQEVETA